jgi:hypothetical protein
MPTKLGDTKGAHQARGWCRHVTMRYHHIPCPLLVPRYEPLFLEFPVQSNAASSSCRRALLHQDLRVECVGSTMENLL